VAGQGWHFAKPMNAASATSWLTEHCYPAGPVQPTKRRIVERLPMTREIVPTPPSGWLR